MSETIALVDDDQNILTSVSIALESEGYEVLTFCDGHDVLVALQQQAIDLAVLDIKMPNMDGFELLNRIRRQSQMPVIFLTSKDDEVDEVLGLRMGADDYIKKPFSQRLLIERIRTILRRHDGAKLEGAAVPSPPTQTKTVTQDVLCRGDLLLEPVQHRCTWKGEALNLTVTEFMLIKTLALHPGHVKTRDQLMDTAYGDTVYVDDRTIDSHIKRLRKKFKQIDKDFNSIETLYGVGYRFKE